MTGYSTSMDVWVITMSWLVVLVLGVVVTFYGVQAYLKTSNRSMLALAGGFAFCSIGTAGSWFGIYGATNSLFQAQLGCVSFLAVGFGLILYSLLTRVS